MRRAVSLTAVVALSLLALAPMAASAGTIAEPVIGGPQSRAAYTPELTIHPAGGYQLTVGEREGAVAVTVTHKEKGKGITATSYVARGTADSTQVQASFGRFGRISMRFHPSGPKGQKPHCGGSGPVPRLMRRGVFVGTLRFRGEGGYVSVDVHRAKGAISKESRRCLKLFIRRHLHPHHRGRALARAGGANASSELPYLAALWKGPTGSDTFVALKVLKKCLFLATTSGNAGRVSVFRLALAIGHGSNFKVNGALSAARVSGRFPFTGSGSYAAAPDGSSTWDGSLAVHFPGASPLSLTGPPLQTSVGTLPPLFALFLLRTARSGDAVALSRVEQPSLLPFLGR